MFQGFVNPALLAGMALVSVPVLIHLLNRQRHKPVRWAAMQFVLAAHKKTRRRVQLENLLLLLLRMAAVALLALAISRPFVGGSSPLATLTETRRDVVLILDGSASTGWTDQTESLFERIRGRALGIVDELDGAAGDRVHVIHAGATPRLVSWPTPDKARTVIGTLAPTDERLDLAAALGEALRIIEEDAAGTGSSEIELRFLSDLQQDAFLDPAQAILRPALGEQLTRLKDLQVDVLVEDLGPASPNPANLAIQDVVIASDNATVGEPLDLVVRVAAFGDAEHPALRVGLTLDGNRLPSQRIDVPKGGTAEALFRVVIDQPGAHTVDAEIEGDRLAIDDHRASVIVLPPPVRVLVVNGERADALEDDAAGYMVLSLEAPDENGTSTPFQITEVSPAELAGGDVDLFDHDVVWLVAAPPLSEAVVADLERAVGGGQALIVTCGNSMGDPSLFDDRLYRSDGTGLLPAELTHVVTAARRDSYYRVATFDEQHPILGFFSTTRNKGMLSKIPVHAFVHARPLERARVLATLDDENDSPLLIESDYDQGRVYLWTTSIGESWTPLPRIAPAMIPLVLEWTRHAARARASQRDLAPGSAVGLEADEFPRSPELVGPAGGRTPLDAEPTETVRGTFRLPEITGDATLRAGLYRVVTENGPELPFAIQLDARESDLGRIPSHEMESLHPALKVLAPDASGNVADGNDGSQGELWRTLAMLALLALVCESLWGAWIGQRRRVIA